ncbi:MAG: anthranilate synthase component I family protein [Bacteroidetes bacterium]|nr:anthranilate synthase component I family protein [Bacteroidota bacterium]
MIKVTNRIANTNMHNDKLKQFRAFAILNNNHHAFGFRHLTIASNSVSESPLDSVKNQFTFLNYDYKNKIENLTSQGSSALRFPQSFYFSPELISEYIPEDEQKSMPVKLQCITSKEEYIEKVKALKHHIQLGDIYEINYCITFEAKNAEINPFDVFNKLNALSQAPYSALVKLDDRYIICASPELFLSKRGNKLITKPIKGTARRSTNSHEDEQIKNELKNSLKERTENVMIVDVARNDFSRIAKKGSVIVEKLYDIESYQQVHQMVSTVSCELKDGISFNEIIHATFPMASMTGAPKIRAMQLIDDFETCNRGPFSGTIGYIDEKGDFDLNVLIRSIFYNEKEKYLSFSVGSAITHLCDPEKEYEECLLKAAALIKSLE